MRVVQKYGLVATDCATIDTMADRPASPAPPAALYLRAPHSRTPRTETASAGPPNTDLLRDLVRYEYRSMVIRQLQITVEWQSLEWLDLAACKKTGTADQERCRSCPVRAPCLAVAIAIDDPAEWRGGIHRDERDALWEQLESAFLTLRDHELMRLDRLVDGRSAM